MACLSDARTSAAMRASVGLRLAQRGFTNDACPEKSLSMHFAQANPLWRRVHPSTEHHEWFFGTVKFYLTARADADISVLGRQRRPFHYRDTAFVFEVW